MNLIGRDRLRGEEKFIAVYFTGKRKVLSTAPMNGGIHTGLKAVFNLDVKPEEGKEIVLEGGTYERHLYHVSQNLLGVSGDVTTGMITAAQMKNAGYARRQYKDLAVTAIVTGGIDKNGGRAGDPAFWEENAGVFTEIKGKEDGPPSGANLPEPGTINIMLFMDGNLTDGALTRALVTCTEAKTAAIQELSLPSRYSCGLATGSGTDSTILVSNMESPLLLTEAGKHCKLGELIGSAVKEAVKEALYRQTGAGPKRQKHVFCRLERYGITAEKLWNYALDTGMAEPEEKERFLAKAAPWARDTHAAAWAILEAHLLDEKSWGMLREEEMREAEQSLWKGFFCGNKETENEGLQRRMAEEIMKNPTG